MTQNLLKNEIIIYEKENGEIPFVEWLGSFDITIKARIRNRITKFEMGHKGDYRNIGDGVSELRLFFGPGYRVYYSEISKGKIILLYGGTKKTQKKDINKAKEYLLDFKELKNEKI